MVGTSLRTALLLAAALALPLSGCQVTTGGDDGDQEVTAREKVFSDDRFAFTFSYPGRFRPGGVDEDGPSRGGEPTAKAAVLLDEDNGILLAKYEPRPSVTRENVADLIPQLDRAVSQVSGNPARGNVVELGGLPGIEYDDVDLDDPSDGQSRLVFLFDRTVEYLINCQSRPKERASVEEACDRALSTLRPGGAPASSPSGPV